MGRFWTSAALRGDTVYVRGYDELGHPLDEAQPLKPYMFYEAMDGQFQTLDGIPCAKKPFSGWREARDWIRDREGLSNSPTYGMSQFLYTHLNDNFPGEVEYDPALVVRGSIDIETKMSGGFPDIATANKAITAITLTRKQHGQRRVLMFAYKGPYRPKVPGVEYVMCRDEQHMLEAFLLAWNLKEDGKYVWMPDILTGWNIEGFDIPYMINRIRRVLGEDRVRELSPWRFIKEREVVRGQSAGSKTSTQVVYEIFGVSALDYFHLYKKFSFKNHESYKLDHIAFVELGRRKKDYSQYADLDQFYELDFEGYLDYNLEDSLLVDDLDDKCGFIDLVMAFAYDAKVTFNDTMTTTRPWDVIIHNHLYRENVVVPQSLGSSWNGSIVGGYVKDSRPGMYEGVASFDFDSLYPHLIMGWNISPETYLGRVDFDAIESFKRGTFDRDVAALQPMLKERDAILAGNGCLFSRSKRGFLPQLMEKMYEDRKAYKKKMLEAKQLYEETKDPKYKRDVSRYHNLQLAKKIQLNSAFGALANEYFRWFANYLAEAVTTSGQMSTMWTEIGVNAFMNRVLGTEGVDYVIAADTDSLYLNIAPLNKRVVPDKKSSELIDFMKSACDGKVLGVIKKRCQELTDMVGCPTCKLNMKRENLADKGIWTAKKRYILNVWDSEGVRFKEPEIKVTGIEAVRSSTPMICREKIREALRVFIDSDEAALQDFIAEFREEFYSRPFHEVASPRGISGMDKYRDAANVYGKGTPIQVRGALLFNKLVTDMGLGDKYPLIYDGTKIKFCYLKLPNPIRENVIAVPETLPPEFGLEPFIDFESQYETVFVSPLMKIADAVGWKTEKSSSLLDLI